MSVNPPEDPMKWDFFQIGFVEYFPERTIEARGRLNHA
jgi:hypothetical protein